MMLRMRLRINRSKENLKLNRRLFNQNKPILNYKQELMNFKNFKMKLKFLQYMRDQLSELFESLQIKSYQKIK